MANFHMQRAAYRIVIISKHPQNSSRILHCETEAKLVLLSNLHDEFIDRTGPVADNVAIYFEATRHLCIVVSLEMLNNHANLLSLHTLGIFEHFGVLNPGSNL